jgi:hypothetical protein
VLLRAAISKTGGSVLGYLPLELDIEPMASGVGTSHRVWGWHIIVNYAETAFGGGTE